MVIKLLILTLALYLGYRLAKVLVRKKLQSLFGAPKAEIKKEDKLIQCAGCGTWVKKAESVQKRGKRYCSKDCIKT